MERKERGGVGGLYIGVLVVVGGGVWGPEIEKGEE